MHKIHTRTELIMDMWKALAYDKTQTTHKYTNTSETNDCGWMHPFHIFISCSMSSVLLSVLLIFPHLHRSRFSCVCVYGKNDIFPIILHVTSNVCLCAFRYQNTHTHTHTDKQHSIADNFPSSLLVVEFLCLGYLAF